MKSVNAPQTFQMGNYAECSLSPPLWNFACKHDRRKACRAFRRSTFVCREEEEEEEEEEVLCSGKNHKARVVGFVVWRLRQFLPPLNIFYFFSSPCRRRLFRRRLWRGLWGARKGEQVQRSDSWGVQKLGGTVSGGILVTFLECN